MTRTPPLLVAALLACVLVGCERAETPTLDAPPGTPPPADATPDAAVATLRGLTVGDRACHATLVDAQGRQREEMAVFEVCEREDLVGRAVHVRIDSGEVIAEACEGDPECDRTETVPLVVDLTAAD